MPSINLAKDQKVDLTKTNPGLTQIKIGLGWKARGTPGDAFDLDGSVIALDAVGKGVDFVFYNNLKSTDGAIVHSGDNRTGDAVGDDESILVDFTKLNPIVDKLVIVASIDQAKERKQTFGMVNDAYIRVCTPDGKDITRYDLSEDGCGDAGMVFAELYKHQGEWKEKAIGKGCPGGLAVILQGYGFQV